MTLNEYQEKAKETAIYPKYRGLEYTTLGLVGEAGEIANKVKKIIRDDDGILLGEKRSEIAGELGDVLWYVAQIAEELDIHLVTVAENNLNKLSVRKKTNTLKGSGDKRGLLGGFIY